MIDLLQCKLFSEKLSQFWVIDKNLKLLLRLIIRNRHYRQRFHCKDIPEEQILVLLQILVYHLELWIQWLVQLDLSVVGLHNPALDRVIFSFELQSIVEETIVAKFSLFDLVLEEWTESFEVAHRVQHLIFIGVILLYGVVLVVKDHLIEGKFVRMSNQFVEVAEIDVDIVRLRVLILNILEAFENLKVLVAILNVNLKE